MTLIEYQQQAMTTCLPEANNFNYMMLNLVGEVGEFSGKIAKAIRKGKLHVIKGGQIGWSTDVDDIEILDFDEELRKEAGDILWQLTGLCEVMGWLLEDIAQENLDKLADRKSRHVIDGSGDNR